MVNKLIIDSRENSDLSNAVKRECIALNIMTEKQWIEVGDYVFSDVCFEAKSTIDGPKKAAKLMTTICKMRPINRDVISPTLMKRITTDDLRINMLATIKGISTTKAQILIDDFGSLMEIGEATVDELTKIDGIGITLAQRIIDTLNSEDKVTI
jgi:ERCC4-type nuclease